MQPAADPRAIRAVRVLAVDRAATGEREEALAGEEPLQIRVASGMGDATDIAVTMRTPGHEQELATGFLLTEGLLTIAEARTASFAFADVLRTSKPDNEITVRLTGPFDASRVRARAFVATASCGICGTASIDDIERRCEPLAPGPRLPASLIFQLPARMRQAQDLFTATGGLHAAALFNADGELLALREDVGRHNALDKLIGARALAGAFPLHDNVLLVSGRASYEIVQKAAMAGISMLCAVSAPSDLAVETADRLGMTLIGFLRGERLNVYTGRDRLEVPGAA